MLLGEGARLDPDAVPVQKKSSGQRCGLRREGTAVGLEDRMRSRPAMTGKRRGRSLGRVRSGRSRGCSSAKRTAGMTPVASLGRSSLTSRSH